MRVAIHEMMGAITTDETLFAKYLVFLLVLIAALSVLALFALRSSSKKAEAITERRVSEASSIQNDRILTLVNNLADAVISTDMKSNVVIYNAAFVNLIDTNSSVFNKPVDSLLTLNDTDDKPVRFSKLLSSARALTVTDDLVLSVGGEQLRIEATYAPIRGSYENDQAGEGYVIILRDVTRTKSLEEERDEFISVVSHELRTPIAITEGAIDNAKVIFERDPTKLDAVASSLATAHEQVLFLARMVNDLSTLSRAERGVADEAEVIDVKQLIHDMFNEYAPQAEAKKLKFELAAHGKLGTVTVSRLYLQELLQNFITNAIKYTKEGHVTLEVKARAGKVNFSVSDSGIGISKLDQQKIFEKFYRAEDYRTRETSGTGLGLYVAAKLAKKLSTKIDVKSRLNHGSTFSFELKLDDAPKTPTKV